MTPCRSSANRNGAGRKGPELQRISRPRPSASQDKPNGKIFISFNPQASNERFIGCRMLFNRDLCINGAKTQHDGHDDENHRLGSL